MPKGEQTEGQKKDRRLDFFGNRAIKCKWTIERGKSRFFLRIIKKKERKMTGFDAEERKAE